MEEFVQLDVIERRERSKFNTTEAQDQYQYHHSHYPLQRAVRYEHLHVKSTATDFHSAYRDLIMSEWQHYQLYKSRPLITPVFLSNHHCVTVPASVCGGHDCQCTKSGPVVVH